MPNNFTAQGPQTSCLLARLHEGHYQRFRPNLDFFASSLFTISLDSNTTMAPPGISSLWFSFVQSRPCPEARTDPNAGLDFDAGINTSAAWTGHIDADNTPTQPFTDGPEPSSSPKLHSLSDDEPEDDEIEEGEQDGRPARVLYGFEGKPEFRELVVESGEEIEVLKEEVGDGWSLVRNVAGEMGLLPRAYYTVSLIVSYRSHGRSCCSMYSVNPCSLR